MEQIQRAALPSFMQERMAALESAGYAVQETCRDNDHFTAGMENQQGRVLVIVGKAETGGRHGKGWRFVACVASTWAMRWSWPCWMQTVM